MERKIGIYLFKNKINGKVYIGQSVDINKRIKSHKYKGSVFYKAIQKYGWDNFECQILEECTIESLDILEEQYISKYNACDSEYGYNILTSANDNPTRGKPRSQEVKDKISKKRIGRYTGVDNPFYGKTQNEAALKIMSDKKKEAYIGEGNPFYGKTHTEETKKKLKLIAQERDMSHCYKKVIQLDKETKEIIKIWDSIAEAAEFLTGNRKDGTRITAACNGRIASAIGYAWRHLN